MIKPYTTDFASLSPADLRAARKIADAEVMAAEATLAGQRNKRDALKLEAFRRLHAKRIDTVIATIQAATSPPASTARTHSGRSAILACLRGTSSPAETAPGATSPTPTANSSRSCSPSSL